MSLQRKENNLRRAQARLDRIQKPPRWKVVSHLKAREFQIDYRREPNRHGRYRTRAYIVRGAKAYHGNNRGLIHKAVNLKYRVQGDKPSVTRTIKSWQPTTVRGKLFKVNARAVNFAVHDVTQTAVDTALATETVGLKVSDTAQREVRNKLKQKYTREAVDDYHRGVFLIPVIVILLVFGIITMLFSATSSHSGFTLGTYAAQDYDLSEAEKYYTELAYNLNQKIRKVSSSADWQSGLAAFGANTGELTDTPDEWVWGRSSVYDYDPVYDFDTYKLWSFLCAYYYDFDADNDDIYYWEFDGDTEDLLEEIFNDEYEFMYWYDNQSRWEELSPYNYWGGGNASSGTYYRAEALANGELSINTNSEEDTNESKIF